MKPMPVIVSDIERVVTALDLVESLSLDTSDPTDALLKRLYKDRVTDAPALMKWIEVWVGRVATCYVLKDLHLKYNPDEPVDTLIKRWFSYRGVGQPLQPQARPDELAQELTEMAQQVATEPVKFDAVRLIETRLASLMRYTSLFYWRELGRSGRLTQRGETDIGDLEVARMLENLSLSELCKLLNCDTPLKAKPYDPTSKQTVTLSSGVAGISLSRLADLIGAASAWSSDQSRELSDCLLAVLREWHGDNPYTPKGCAVAKIDETGFTSQLTCHDEIGGTVILAGVTSSLKYGNDVLVRVREEGEVWAPKPQKVPDGGVWKMPKTVLRHGRSDREFKVPTRDQVFISYSHADYRWLKELKKYLEPYIRNTMLAVWDDSKIEAGAVWKESIRQALATAKVAVLLVTPDFLASKFIAEQELPPLLEAANSDGVAILWVPVRDSSYKVTPIAAYQAAHPPEKPLASLRKPARDKALVKICDVIQQEYRR